VGVGVGEECYIFWVGISFLKRRSDFENPKSAIKKIERGGLAD
jgi:hypothetical protein